MIVEASPVRGTPLDTGSRQVDLTYLGSGDLDLADAAEDMRGMDVVDMNGHRLGEVADLLIDTEELRVRLLAVSSGGVLGLSTYERLIPVEAVRKVDDRVHVDVTDRELQTGTRQPLNSPSATGSATPRQVDMSYIAEVYRHYGLPPSWTADRALRASS